MSDHFELLFHDVCFRYEGDEGEPPLPLAVDGVNLRFGKGEFAAIVGRNGSGKSTLAKLANGLLLPESGQVTVCDMDTKDEEKEYDIRSTVGVVFQNPDNQIVAAIVEEDVAFGPENLGVEPAEIRRRVDDALKSVGMYEYRLHEPHKLSGGQKQRVAIAGIIAMMPQCLILDEPTAMLDPEGRAEVLATVRKLNREHGITVIFITHFMDEAVQADRVIVMNRSKVVADATPGKVFADFRTVTDAGLDVPQSVKLAVELNKRGYPLGSGLLTPDAFASAFGKFAERYE